MTKSAIHPRQAELSRGKSGKSSRDLKSDSTTKLDLAYLPHLVLNESFIQPGEEWMPKTCEWTLIHVAAGSGYWMGSAEKQELPAGAALLLSARAPGNIRASLLGEMVLHSFALEPRRLSGLFTLQELRFFEAAINQEKYAARVFPADTLLATSMKTLLTGEDGNKTLFRLQLLELFVAAFGDEIISHGGESTAPRQAKDRLEAFLRQTSASELLNFSLTDLAQMARCTTRHLNRIFNEVVGVSFREKHTELRLARACELLATTQAKVVDVALESGYQSLSLFNSMFTRRYGVSPGKWRENLRQGKTPAARRVNQKSPYSPVCNLFVTRARNPMV